MPIPIIMGILAKKYPQLSHNYKILQTSRFTTEGRNHIPGRRSRVGDMIVLMEASKEFISALKTFPEDFPFRMSGGWWMTNKGGIRAGLRKSDQKELELSDIFKSLIMEGAADETMEKTNRT